MGVLDKLKNALFEVEYVEVEEPVKKEKKAKPEKPKTEDKPIAKKVVLPGKKEEKIEELQEEELKDYNFESRPKDETIKEDKHSSFKFMDDNDFKMDDEYVPGEPEIVKVLDEEILEYDEEDFGQKPSSYREESHDRYKSDYSHEHTHNKPYSAPRESKPYGMDNTYNVPVHEYGTYERKEEKTHFRPSPIISPIYGILDKNYKKEDVVPKKEIRLTTYTRGNVSVDEIRNKAYGPTEKEEIEEVETTFEVEEDNNDLLVDLSDRAKPEVKEVTMGDALEYFQDLGLEYNVDYVDASKERNTSRRVKENYDEVEEKEIEPEIETETKVEINTETEEKEIKPVEIVEEKQDDTDTDDDNLFDLIDSMYQETE